MGRRKRYGRMSVEVVGMVNGSTCRDWYTASWVTAQLWDGGRALLLLRDGSDDHGPVDAVHYAHAEKIVRRPLGHG